MAKSKDHKVARGKATIVIAIGKTFNIGIDLPPKPRIMIPIYGECQLVDTSPGTDNAILWGINSIVYERVRDTK